MTLPKHLRPRYRYLAVEFHTRHATEVGRREIQDALWQSARRLLGDVGSAGVDLQLLRFATTDGPAAGIIRTRRGAESRARAVIACVHTVDETTVGVVVKGVSGTIRACAENHFPENEAIK